MARFIARHMGEVSSAPQGMPYTVGDAVNGLSAAVAQAAQVMDKVNRLGTRFANSDSPASKKAFLNLLSECAGGAGSIRTYSQDLCSNASAAYKHLRDGGTLITEGSLKGPDHTTTILRQLIVLEKEFRGKLFLGANPARITIVLEDVVAKYMRDKKCIGRLAFDPIHLHFFPGSAPSNAFAAQVLKKGTGPDYAKLQELNKWREAHVTQAHINHELEEIGLVSTNAPFSTAITQPHPHIYGTGLCCQGDGAMFVGYALAEGRVYDAFKVMVDIMTDPKGVKDGCENFHNILFYPHVEKMCTSCGETVPAQEQAKGTPRVVHEKCVKARCPDTGLPIEAGDPAVLLSGIKYHKDAVYSHIATGMTHRKAEGLKTSKSGATWPRAEAAMCHLSGEVGHIVQNPSQSSYQDDVVPWGDRYVSVSCIDMAHKPQEEPNGEAESIPVKASKAWWDGTDGERRCASWWRRDRYFAKYYCGTDSY